MGTTAPTSSPVDEKSHSLLQRLLINRNYALLWTAMATSQFGNIVFNIAMILWVATTLARNAPWVAFAVGALTFLPRIVTFVFSSVAGVYVDRWNKRRTLLLTDGTNTILTLILVFAVSVVPLVFPVGSDIAAIFQLIVLLLIIGLMSICTPFVNGALVAILYEVVEEADFPTTFGREQFVNNLSIILAPPLAAAIFFAIGVQWIIILDALTFAVSFICIFLIRPTPLAHPSAQEEGEEPSKNSFVADLLQGLRFVAGNSVLIAMLVSTVLTTLGIAAVTLLCIFFVTNNLQSPPAYYPLLDVAFGVGAMGGAVIAPILKKKIGLLRTFWLPGLMTGSLILVFSRLTNIWAGAVVMLLIGASEAILLVATGPLAMKVTPQELIGRANAVFVQLGTLASVISTAGAAFLVTTPFHNKHFQVWGISFGPVDAVLMAAGIMIITSGLCAMVTLNHYMHVEAQEEAEEQEEQVPLAPARSGLRRKQVAIICAGLLVAVCSTLPALFAPSAYQPVDLIQQAQQQPATGQPVAGLRCTATVGSHAHLSIHLSIYIQNKAVALPAGIGIVAPAQPGVVALATQGKTNCLYPLHVYENDNIIHAELFNDQTYYLGQFFDIWGQPLSRAQLSGYHVAADQSLVFEIFNANGDQHIYAGDPRKIPLLEHETIVVLLNSPDVHPTAFSDWNGL